jgi:hypothetical protein
MNEIVDGGKKLFLCSALYAPVQQKNAPDNGSEYGSSGAPPLNCLGVEVMFSHINVSAKRDWESFINTV